LKRILGCEYYATKKSDVVTEFIDECVSVTDAQIDGDTGENMVKCGVGLEVYSLHKVGWTPLGHSESGVYRLTLVVEDRA
jgi:hypothetical protein